MAELNRNIPCLAGVLKSNTLLSNLVFILTIGSYIYYN